MPPAWKHTERKGMRSLPGTVLREYATSYSLPGTVTKNCEYKFKLPQTIQSHQFSQDRKLQWTAKECILIILKVFQMNLPPRLCN